MSLLWPAVRASVLASAATAMPGVTVYDGAILTRAPALRYAIVGATTEDPEREITEATFTVERVGAPDGMVRETGVVPCEVAVVSGSTALSSERADAFALADAWTAALVGLSVAGAQALAVRVEVTTSDIQSSAGSGSRLVLAVTYEAFRAA